MKPERRRLARGYFFYFATFGVFVPFWPPYLAARGYDAVSIGTIMGILAAVRVVGPPLYAHWADVSGQRVVLLRGAALVALACSLAFPWLGSAVGVAAVLAAYGASWYGILSVYDAHVLDTLGADAGRYGLLRLWGSLGFIVMASCSGWLLDQVGIARLPYLLAVFILLTWLSMLGLGRGGQVKARAGVAHLLPLLRDRRMLSFLAVSFLMLASHGAYYNFFSIYLQDRGFSRTAIGALWAWGAIAEIGVLLHASRLLARYSLRALLVTALAATSLRWILMGLFASSPWVVFGAQTLHLASFGLFHVSAVALAGMLLPREAAARGQALYASVGSGLGGAAGAFASGWIWGTVSAEAAFLCSAVAAAAATVIAAIGLRGLPLVVRQVQNA